MLHEVREQLDTVGKRDKKRTQNKERNIGWHCRHIHTNTPQLRIPMYPEFPRYQTAAVNLDTKRVEIACPIFA